MELKNTWKLNQNLLLGGSRDFGVLVGLLEGSWAYFVSKSQQVIGKLVRWTSLPPPQVGLKIDQSLIKIRSGGHGPNWVFAVTLFGVHAQISY